MAFILTHVKTAPAISISAALIAVTVFGTATTPSGADTVTTAHAIAMHGKPKYAAGFTHFDYVNPGAPKGGVLRLARESSFDSFHPYIAKGSPATTDSGAAVIPFITANETLLALSADEPYTAYGLIAESITWPADRSWVVFDLHPQARWHDGAAITAADVVWSFRTLTAAGRPFYRSLFAGVRNVEELGERRVKFTFAGGESREMPLLVGQMPVLPRHYWRQRDFAKTTLEPPLGSGPYRIKKFEAGRYVIEERVKNYWGRDLPVNRGLHNFDQKRTDYYRDITAIRLALKSGRIDFRHENTAKAWALDYGIDAVTEGRLIKDWIPSRKPTGMQAFIYNVRRPVFRQPLVREALAYAFDYEWTNRALFFGQYKRTRSYFSNSDLASDGLPADAELALLNRYRGRIPARVFEQAYRPPATDGGGWPRENLLHAARLLKQAGWVVKDFRLVHGETGEAFTFEFMIGASGFERILLPFVRNLKRLGIEARVRVVDYAQYVRRARSFDFDMMVHAFGQTESPGNEQRALWGSADADRPGSRNYIGIKNEVVDELAKLVATATTRENLIARTRALDRVLLWNFYVIPNWHLPAVRILYWDKFSRPAAPVRAGEMLSRWWFDQNKAAALEAGAGGGGEQQ